MEDRLQRALRKATRSIAKLRKDGMIPDPGADTGGAAAAAGGAGDPASMLDQAIAALTQARDALKGGAAIGDVLGMIDQADTMIDGLIPEDQGNEVEMAAKRFVEAVAKAFFDTDTPTAKITRDKEQVQTTAQTAGTGPTTGNGTGFYDDKAGGSPQTAKVNTETRPTNAPAPGASSEPYYDGSPAQKAAAEKAAAEKSAKEKAEKAAKEEAAKAAKKVEAEKVAKAEAEKKAAADKADAERVAKGGVTDAAEGDFDWKKRGDINSRARANRMELLRRGSMGAISRAELEKSEKPGNEKQEADELAREFGHLSIMKSVPETEGAAG